MTYIEQKLKEFDDIVEKVESFEFDQGKEIKEYLESADNKLFWDFEYPESKFELNVEKVRDFIKKSLTEAYNQGKIDYHNHIVEKIKEPSDIRTAKAQGEAEDNFDFGYDTKTKEILSLLQDTKE